MFEALLQIKCGENAAGQGDGMFKYSEKQIQTTDGVTIKQENKNEK